jgi:hypothetical protein
MNTFRAYVKKCIKYEIIHQCPISMDCVFEHITIGQFLVSRINCYHDLSLSRFEFDQLCKIQTFNIYTWEIQSKIHLVNKNNAEEMMKHLQYRDWLVVHNIYLFKHHELISPIYLKVKRFMDGVFQSLVFVDNFVNDHIKLHYSHKLPSWKCEQLMSVTYFYKCVMLYRVPSYKEFKQVMEQSSQFITTVKECISYESDYGMIDNNSKHWKFITFHVERFMCLDLTSDEFTALCGIYAFNSLTWDKTQVDASLINKLHNNWNILHEQISSFGELVTHEALEFITYEANNHELRPYVFYLRMCDIIPSHIAVKELCHVVRKETLSAEIIQNPIVLYKYVSNHHNGSMCSSLFVELFQIKEFREKIRKYKIPVHYKALKYYSTKT